VTGDGKSEAEVQTRIQEGASMWRRVDGVNQTEKIQEN